MTACKIIVDAAAVAEALEQVCADCSITSMINDIASSAFSCLDRLGASRRMERPKIPHAGPERPTKVIKPRVDGLPVKSRLPSAVSAERK